MGQVTLFAWVLEEKGRCDAQQAEFGGNEKKKSVKALSGAVFGEKEPKGWILLTWGSDTCAQMWMFRHEEVNLPALVLPCLPFRRRIAYKVIFRCLVSKLCGKTSSQQPPASC